MNLDLSKFVNIETGELLVSELTDEISLKILKDTNLVLVDSKNYFIVDTEAMTTLLQEKIITKGDFAQIVVIAKTLKTEYNAAYNYNIPHTLTTLATLLELSYERTTSLVKKLCRKNIMHKYVAADITLYCLNPYLTRRRKHFDKDLLALFSKFYK